jgi:D-amino-acid dehydrogenase
VFFAFGHHHVGLTGGPKTGRLIAELITGSEPNIDLTPYRVDRFGQKA